VHLINRGERGSERDSIRIKAVGLGTSGVCTLVWAQHTVCSHHTSKRLTADEQGQPGDCVAKTKYNFKQVMYVRTSSESKKDLVKRTRLDVYIMAH
jgi:hypothetical protein